MDRVHDSFDDYCAALKSAYRYELNRSRKKFARSGLEIVRVEDGAEISQIYSDHLHHMYKSVVERADHRLELLPVSFFRALAASFPEDVSLLLVKRGLDTVAFGYSIAFAGCYYMLFMGLERDADRCADVYFNVFYDEMDNWLGGDLPRAHMGQASDEFKSRLGCRAIRLSCYVKGTGAMRPFVRSNVGWLFPAPTPWKERHIYKAQRAVRCDDHATEPA